MVLPAARQTLIPSQEKNSTVLVLCGWAPDTQGKPKTLRASIVRGSAEIYTNVTIPAQSYALGIKPHLPKSAQACKFGGEGACTCAIRQVGKIMKVNFHHLLLQHDIYH